MRETKEISKGKWIRSESFNFLWKIDEVPTERHPDLTHPRVHPLATGRAPRCNDVARRSGVRRGGGVVARALSRREARAIAAARRLSQDVDVSRGAPFGRCRSVSVPRTHAPRLIALRSQTPRFWGETVLPFFYTIPSFFPFNKSSTRLFPRDLQKKRKIKRK